MLTDYTFLTDHSYSLRPIVDDNDGLLLNKTEEKNKKRPRSSNRLNKTPSTANRTVSIDRSSSDKENTSSSITASLSATSSSSTTNKNKSTGSRRSRLSTRTAMTNSRTQTGKNKPASKTGIKSTQGSIKKKRKTMNRGKTKLLNISHLDSSDVVPSLSSIEERVKLRRTKPLQPSPIVLEKKSTKTTKSPARRTKIPDTKPIRQPISKNSSNKSKYPSVKTTKSFLGSGLDLDNIVLGNRQRRCVQT